jgi:hypothetical protein
VEKFGKYALVERMKQYVEVWIDPEFIEGEFHRLKDMTVPEVSERVKLYKEHFNIKAYE